MSIIEKIKASSPPPVLYHYSSQEGFLGIMSTDDLWASKVHYLNDSTEYELALNLASNILKSRIEESEGKEKDKLECLLGNIPEIRNLNVCVASLTEKRDLLSQWRAYGESAGSISIGLNTDALLKKANEHNFFLAECIYVEEQQEQIVSSLIDECMAEDFNMVDSKTCPKKTRTIIVLATGGNFTKKLATIAPILKNKSFQEEAEWRLVSDYGVSVLTMNFRPGASTITPYFNFSLGVKKEYLSSLTVGPTPQKELARNALRMISGKYNVGQTAKIYETDIPFRNW